jgi:hypothetical protein
MAMSKCHEDTALNRLLGEPGIYSFLFSGPNLLSYTSR